MLAFADKVFSGVDMFESFGCCCFGPVVACTVVVVDNSGQGNASLVQIGGAEE